MQWNWLQEQFCNLSLYTLYIMCVINQFKKIQVSQTYVRVKYAETRRLLFGLTKHNNSKMQLHRDGRALPATLTYLQPLAEKWMTEWPPHEHKTDYLQINNEQFSSWTFHRPKHTPWPSVWPTYKGLDVRESDQWGWDHVAGESATTTLMLLRRSHNNTSEAIRATVFVLSHSKGKGHPITGTLHSFLTSSLFAGQRSRPCPRLLTPVTH